MKTSSFGFGCTSMIPKPWAVRINAAVPSGRNVSSASCEDPNRPMPSPATPFTPKSNFLLSNDQRALAPPPPPVRVSLNAPAAPADAEAVHVMGFPVKVVVDPSVLVTTPVAWELTTAQG